MAFEPTPPAKMMLGFVVRRCAVAVGHDPSPEELVRWANNQRDGERTRNLFGRPITVDEARLILRHPARPVTARRITPDEAFSGADTPAATSKVVSFAAAMARAKARVKRSS